MTPTFYYNNSTNVHAVIFDGHRGGDMDDRANVCIVLVGPRFYASRYGYASEQEARKTLDRSGEGTFKRSNKQEFKSQLHRTHQEIASTITLLLP